MTLPVLIHIFTLTAQLPFLHLSPTFSSSNNLIIFRWNASLVLAVCAQIYQQDGRTTNWDRKIACANHKERATYHISPMSHEDGKVGQVTAGASGVALVGFQQFTALSGPVSHHASLWVIPEGTVGIVVVLFLQNINREKEWWNIYEHALQYEWLYTGTPCMFHIYNWKRQMSMHLMCRLCDFMCACFTN